MASDAHALNKTSPGFSAGEGGGEIHLEITKPGRKLGSGRLLPKSPET